MPSGSPGDGAGLSRFRHPKALLKPGLDREDAWLGWHTAMNFQSALAECSTRGKDFAFQKDLSPHATCRRALPVQPSTIFERAFFQCPNCGRVSDYLAALSRD
jgi:hypothetical protein